MGKGNGEVSFKSMYLSLKSVVFFSFFLFLLPGVFHQMPLLESENKTIRTPFLKKMFIEV